MSYIVKTQHYRPTYRNGDREDELITIDAQSFKTRRAAKEFIENALSGKRNVNRSYHKGSKPSKCVYFTGYSWIHENTGERCEEYYAFILEKA